jgi:hypothetical protein
MAAHITGQAYPSHTGGFSSFHGKGIDYGMPSGESRSMVASNQVKMWGDQPLSKYNNPYSLLYGVANKEVGQDPDLSFDEEIRNLPDAYVGKNTLLGKILISQMTASRSYAIDEICPYEQTDSLTTSIMTWKFNDEFLGQVPEQGVPRVISNNMAHIEGSVGRKGISFTNEHMFLSTPMGEQCFWMQMEQINNACTDTSAHEIIFKLFNCTSMSDFHAGRGMDAQRFKKIVQNNIQMWGCFQKHGASGFHDALAHAKRIMKERVGTEGNMLIVPEGAQAATWEANLLNAGILNREPIKTASTFWATTDKTVMRESRGYQIYSDVKEDPAYRVRVIGGFNVMNMVDICDIPADKFNLGDHMSIEIWNEDKDMFERLNPTIVFKYTGAFQGWDEIPQDTDFGQYGQLDLNPFRSQQVSYHGTQTDNFLNNGGYGDSDDYTRNLSGTYSNDDMDTDGMRRLPGNQPSKWQKKKAARPYAPWALRYFDEEGWTSHGDAYAKQGYLDKLVNCINKSPNVSDSDYVHLFTNILYPAQMGGANVALAPPSRRNSNASGGSGGGVGPPSMNRYGTGAPAAAVAPIDFTNIGGIIRQATGNEPRNSQPKYDSVIDAIEKGSRSFKSQQFDSYVRDGDLQRVLSMMVSQQSGKRPESTIADQVAQIPLDYVSYVDTVEKSVITGCTISSVCRLAVKNIATIVIMMPDAPNVQTDRHLTLASYLNGDYTALIETEGQGDQRAKFMFDFCAFLSVYTFGNQEQKANLPDMWLALTTFYQSLRLPRFSMNVSQVPCTQFLGNMLRYLSERVPYNRLFGFKMIDLETGNLHPTVPVPTESNQGRFDIKSASLSSLATTALADLKQDERKKIEDTIDKLKGIFKAVYKDKDGRRSTFDTSPDTPVALLALALSPKMDSWMALNGLTAVIPIKYTATLNVVLTAELLRASSNGYDTEIPGLLRSLAYSIAHEKRVATEVSDMIRKLSRVDSEKLVTLKDAEDHISVMEKAVTSANARLRKEEAESLIAAGNVRLPGPGQFDDYTTNTSASGDHSPLHLVLESRNYHKKGFRLDSELMKQILIERTPFSNGFAFFRWVVDHNLPSCFGILSMRPNQRWEMGSMILTYGGGEVGKMLYMMPNMQIQNDRVRKIMIGSLTVYLGCMITDERKVVVVPDVYCRAYLGGWGAKPWDASDSRHQDLQQREPDQRDFYHCLVPANYRPADKWIYLSGQGAGQVAGTNSQNGPSYPTAKFYAQEVWSNWDSSVGNITMQTREGTAQANTMCFQDYQAGYNYRNPSRALIIHNKGPWEESIYEGSAAVRAGGNRVLHKPDTMRVSLVSLVA